jgi:hypothetical protein
MPALSTAFVHSSHHGTCALRVVQVPGLRGGLVIGLQAALRLNPRTRFVKIAGNKLGQVTTLALEPTRPRSPGAWNQPDHALGARTNPGPCPGSNERGTTLWLAPGLSRRELITGRHLVCEPSAGQMAGFHLWAALVGRAVPTRLMLGFNSMPPSLADFVAELLLTEVRLT